MKSKKMPDGVQLKVKCAMFSYLSISCAKLLMSFITDLVQYTDRQERRAHAVGEQR